MNLPEYRTKLAPLLGTTASAILNRQKKTYSIMHELAPPGTGSGRGIRIEATPTNATVILLTVLDAAHIDTVATRTKRLYHAAFAKVGGNRDGDPCPVTRMQTAGAAIAALIEHPELRSGLASIDLEHDTETVSLRWRGGGKSLFHPFADGQQYREAVVEAVGHGSTRTSSLAGTVFSEVAALIPAIELILEMS